MERYNETLIEQIRAEIPAFIGGKRLAHTYAVERECSALADIFTCFPTLLSDEDACRLRIAALLHDITKEKTVSEQKALAAEYHIPLTDYDLASPKVLHAKTAPPLAADRIHAKYGWNVVDDAIQDAIRTHTTGAVQMSLIGKLLYLADYIEDTRTFEACIRLRHMFYDGLDAVRGDEAALCGHLNRVLLYSYDITISDLLSSGALIDAETTAARNALLFQMI